MLDGVVDLGYPVPSGLTRTETAATVDAAVGGGTVVLARQADARIFGPAEVDDEAARTILGRGRCCVAGHDLGQEPVEARPREAVAAFAAATGSAGMRLRFTLVRPGGDVIDLQATVDATVTVGELASALDRCDPTRGDRPAAPSTRGAQLSLRVHPGAVSGQLTLLSPTLPLAVSGIRSGSMLSIGAVTEQWQNPGGNGRVAAATLTVLTGPDAGRSFALRDGTSFLGRDPACEIRLTDPLVSKKHARITIGDTAEINDLGSANGLVIGGSAVPRASCDPRTG